VRLDEAGRGLVKAAMLAGASRSAPAWLQMSARAFHRILKLARTSADLARSECIKTAHLAQAIHCRPRRAV
jgi:magnesium chelatase family protein